MVSGRAFLISIMTCLAALAGAAMGLIFFEASKSRHVAAETREKAQILEIATSIAPTCGIALPRGPEEGAILSGAAHHSYVTSLGGDQFDVSLVGLPGLELSSRAKDDHAASVITSMRGGDGFLWTGLVSTSSGDIIRVVKPVIAETKSCVRCHERKSGVADAWSIGGVMGAFVLDAPVGPALAQLRETSFRIGAGAFVAILAIGLLTIALQRRQEVERAALMLDQEAAKRAHLDEMREVAERSNKAKSDFLASMSHELRTPMNGVLGVAELLAKSDLDERQRMFVNAISGSGGVMMRLIDELLDFSSLDAGGVVLRAAPFRLERVVKDVATTAEPAARAKGLELRWRVGHGGSEKFVGDAYRVGQVLSNLIGNAVKFTSSGRVEVDVDIREPGDGTAELFFRVTDTGPGVPEEQRRDVFERFKQADAGLARSHGGVGLGLAICKSLVDAMGGRIGVDGADGEGASFWFAIRLPRADVEATTEDADAAPARASAA